MGRPKGHIRQVKLNAQERRNRIAVHYIEGKSQHLIAKIEKISVGQVAGDLKQIRKEWLASRVRDFDTAKAEELERLSRLEKEAYEAWHRSKESSSKTKKSIEKGRTLVSQGANRPPRPRMVVTGETNSTEDTERDGDPRFLAMIFQCIQLRLKVLGALEQDKNLNVNVSKIDWDTLYRKAEEVHTRPDPIAQRLADERSRTVIVQNVDGIQTQPNQQATAPTQTPTIIIPGETP